MSRNDSGPLAVSGRRRKRISARISDSADSEDDTSRRKNSAKSTDEISSDTDVLNEVRKSNKLHENLVKRATDTEKRLKIVEEAIKNNGPSCSSGTESTPTRPRRFKHDVPQVVRVSYVHTPASVLFKFVPSYLLA